MKVEDKNRVKVDYLAARRRALLEDNRGEREETKKKGRHGEGESKRGHEVFYCDYLKTNCQTILAKRKENNAKFLTLCAFSFSLISLVHLVIFKVILKYLNNTLTATLIDILFVCLPGWFATFICTVAFETQFSWRQE